MVINHLYRFVYIAAPRTASTSIRDWLRQVPGSFTCDQQHLDDVPEFASDFFRFGTFREPSARLLSLWAYHRLHDPDAKSLLQYLRWLPSLHEFHSRSQLSYYRGCELLAVGEAMQERLISVVFERRGYSCPIDVSLGRINEAPGKRAAGPRLSGVVGELWPDDAEAWRGLLAEHKQL